MKRLLLYLLLVIVLVVGIVLARAPASLIEQALATVPDASLVATRGTLWAGRGSLNVANTHLGQLTWEVAPAALLGGSLSADWTLQGNGLDLAGSADVGLNAASALADGRIERNLLNQVLAAYDIEVESDLTLTSIALEISAIDSGKPVLEALSGRVSSQAGGVRYWLAGQSDSAQLPPLNAELSNAAGSAIAEVTAQGDSAVLMRLGLDPTGLGRVAVTKRFTEMLGRPWSGRDPSHAVVIEVQEQLF